MPTAKKPATKKPQKPTLTHREMVFIEAYLTNGGNATDAAKQAGYSERSARELARRLLTKVDIQKRIKERLNEAKVTSDEVIGTLAAQMRGNITDVLPDDGGLISEIKKKNLGHLIKKIKIRREIDPESKKAFEVAEIELYSSQTAAQTLAKIRGMEQEPQQNQNDAEAERQKYERLIADYIASPETLATTRQQAINDIARAEHYKYNEIRIHKYITG